MQQHRHSWIDRSAMSLSGLCVIHCLAGSLLISTISLTGGLLSHNVHLVGLLLALPLAAVALINGARRHGRIAVLVLGGIGLALMAASLFIAHGTSFEVAISLVGVALLATAHLLNLRWSRG